LVNRLNDWIDGRRFGGYSYIKENSDDDDDSSYLMPVPVETPIAMTMEIVNMAAAEPVQASLRYCTKKR